MKRKCFLVVLVSMAIGGVSMATTALAAIGLTNDVAVQAGGQARSYDLYVPPGMDGARPLVILLHGRGGDADAMLGANGKAAPYKPWLAIAKREGLILAIPDGTLAPDGHRGWNDCRSDAVNNPRVDDVTFTKAMIEDIARRHAIDRRRVYVTGTSNGGHMSLRLAAEMTEVLAAAAPVAAAMPRHTHCNSPSRPLSIAFMNGTADPLTPYQGGRVGRRGDKRGSVISTRDSVQWWLRHNGISSAPERFDYPDRMRDDSSTVHRELYSGGRDGAQVALFEVRGGGHAGPSTSERIGRFYRRIVGPQNGDIEMAEEIWAFFKDKRR